MLHERPGAEGGGPPSGADFPQGCRPLRLVRRQDQAGFVLQFSAPGVVLGQPRQGTLQADERRPIGGALLVEPVGEDQPVRVVVRLGDDRLEKGVGVVHGPHPAGGLTGNCSSRALSGEATPAS
jgi:hypothetical protein